MDLALLGIASSVATEVVTWINQKISGTVFKGDGAFFLSFVFALIAGFYKAFTSGATVISFGDIASLVVQAFGYSQVFYVLIYSKLFGGKLLVSN